MKTLILKIAFLSILTGCIDKKPNEPASKEKAAGKSIVELFPPIDIKSWEKTPALNGRLPTEEETKNGTSLLYYPNPGPDVKPYDMTLPGLAYYTDPISKKQELVVVIQIVKTARDTMVGYRPLTGSNGASVFKDFRFLTEAEIKAVVGK